VKRPSSRDPSTPKADGYTYKKKFYQSDAVAEDYDRHRFTTRARQKRNRREWATTLRALRKATGAHVVLDLPCGTGRFTGNVARAGYEVIGADISTPMMRQALAKPELALDNIIGYVQADAERIPLASASVDIAMSIRFMHHVDSQTRRRILREMGRVSKRWLVIDYRHRYAPRWVIWRIARSLGLTRKPFARVTRREMESEFHDAGLNIVDVLPTRRGLSDKWIVLAESPANERTRVTECAAGSKFADLELGERIGEGRHTNVYAASWRGREVAVKVFKSASVARHDRRVGGPVARFEFERNAQLRAVPDVARYVAEPIGYAIGENTQFVVQERLQGPLYYHYRTQLGHALPESFRAHLERLVSGCHAAGIYDLDVHSMNVVVQREPGGELIPRLFDFNMVPFTVKARNPGQLAMRLGFLRPETGDLRRLNRFDRFGPLERKHVERYFHPAAGPGRRP